MNAMMNNGPEKTNPAPAPLNDAAAAAVADALEFARCRADRRTLAETRTGEDFFEISSAAVRDIVRYAFDAGMRATGK